MVQESNLVAEFILDEVQRLKMSLMDIHDCYLCYLRWRKETRDGLSRLVPEDRNVPIRLLELLYSTTPGPQQWCGEFIEIEKIGNELYRQTVTIYENEPGSGSEEEEPETDYSDDEDANIVIRPLPENGMENADRIYEYY